VSHRPQRVNPLTTPGRWANSSKLQHKAPSKGVKKHSLPSSPYGLFGWLRVNPLPTTRPPGAIWRQTFFLVTLTSFSWSLELFGRCTTVLKGLTLCRRLSLPRDNRRQCFFTPFDGALRWSLARFGRCPTVVKGLITLSGRWDTVRSAPSPYTKLQHKAPSKGVGNHYQHLSLRRDNPRQRVPPSEAHQAPRKSSAKGRRKTLPPFGPVGPFRRQRVKKKWPALGWKNEIKSHTIVSFSH
jgi:hypothetical protein